MLRKPNEAFSFTFHIFGAAGVPVNADSTPTGVFRTNGTDDGAVSITVTNVTTGEYKASGTVPIDYEAGDFSEVIILAVVGGDTIRQVVGTIDVDTSRASDLALQLNTMETTLGQVQSTLNEAHSIVSDPSIDGKTLTQAIQIIGAVVSGVITTAGTGTEIFKGFDGLTTRVTVTVDSSGNRSVVVYA